MDAEEGRSERSTRLFDIVPDMVWWAGLWGMARMFEAEFLPMVGEMGRGCGLCDPGWRDEELVSPREEGILHVRICDVIHLCTA
jgi:hypothetical protein